MKRVTITNVQLLRFAAAASILFSHSADLLLPGNSLLWSLPWAGGVDLFFVISGFIMTWLTQGQFGQPGAATNYLVRRIIRIVPPYWFFTGLMILTVLFFGQHVRNTTVEPSRVVTSLGFIPWPRHDGALNPILSQGWTLNYEMFFYLCFSLALLGRRGLLYLCCGFIALAAIHPIIPEQWFVLRFYSEPIILEFVGGIAIAHIYLAGIRISRAWAAVGGATAIAAFLLFRGFAADARFLALGVPALLLAASLILAPEPKRIGPVMRFVVAGGDASYTLYLSHTFTINAVILVLGSGALVSPVTSLIIAIAAAVATAMLLYRFVEAPLTARLGRAFHRPVAIGPASVAP